MILKQVNFYVLNAKKISDYANKTKNMEKMLNFECK